MEISNGFLIIDKGKNCTSHDCVKEIRKTLNIKKVGHTGTLDPQVTGVLPIALGSATRFIQYLPQEKKYLGIIKLGIKTSTDDIHGQILNKKVVPKLSFKELDNALDHFRGTFQQIPPQVSSIHVDGERAYKRSWRKEKFTLPSRNVTVNKLKLKEFDPTNGLLTIKISCSSGTYIRSIARDLGVILGSEGCLYDLRRIEASGFTEELSIELDSLIKEKNNINKIIIPISLALSHLPRIYLKDEKDILYWRTGIKIIFKPDSVINNKNIFTNQELIVFDKNDKLLGIAISILEEKNLLQPKLVLNAK